MVEGPARAAHGKVLGAQGSGTCHAAIEVFPLVAQADVRAVEGHARLLDLAAGLLGVGELPLHETDIALEGLETQPLHVGRPFEQLRKVSGLDLPGVGLAGHAVGGARCRSGQRRQRGGKRHGNQETHVVKSW